MYKYLEPIDWVKLAIGKNSAREVLTGIHVSDAGAVATDGHRLHWVPRSVVALGDGLWTPGGSPIEGTYPNWQFVVPESGSAASLPAFTVDRDALGVCDAAIAYGKFRGDKCPLVAVPALSGELGAFNAVYFRDALRGMQLLTGCAEAVLFTFPVPTKPALMVGEVSRRKAVLMPVRVPGVTEGAAGQRFSLAEYVKDSSVKVAA